MSDCRISVVTVSFENCTGLELTLSSIIKLCNKPYEIIVVDGGSKDGTGQVVKKYAKDLSIVFISEPDEGIYDAMNKGKRKATGDLVHYLNAGDMIFGDPYGEVSEPGFFEVYLKSENGSMLGREKSVIFGMGYNHQAIIFRADHNDYVLDYSIAADFDLVLDEFPEGFCESKVKSIAHVVYQFGGVSSVKRFDRDKEVFTILLKKRGKVVALSFAIYALAKIFIPRVVRRYLKR